jgi:hypothetical protein
MGIEKWRYTGDLAFDDQFDPLEARISELLWSWASGSDGEDQRLTRNQGDLALAVEFYLCGVFQKVDYTRSRGIWCDGVLDLFIENISACSFRLQAAAYCPHEIAPIEIEFHYKQLNQDQADRVVVRYGDSRHPHKNPRPILRRHIRPTSNEDWLVAVELTSTSSE